MFFRRRKAEKLRSHTQLDTGQIERSLNSTYTSENIDLHAVSTPRYASFAILREAAPVLET